MSYPPTALEIKECPPHLYFIDGKGLGICRKCGLVTDFQKLQQKRIGLELSQEKGRVTRKRGGPRGSTVKRR